MRKVKGCDKFRERGEKIEESMYWRQRQKVRLHTNSGLMNRGVLIDEGVYNEIDCML